MANPSATDEELSKIDALIAQHSVNEVFEGPQLRYSASKSIRYGEQSKQASTVPHGGYRCHRCGDAGHFIQDCPQGTGEDKSGKVRQARGIPKTFLETVTEAEAAKSGGAFVSAEGELVVLKTASTEERLRLVGPSSDVAFQRFFGKCTDEAKRALGCFICESLVREPTVTPCCGELFCRQCILKHLDRTFTSMDGSIAPLECPHCDRAGLTQTDLIPDRGTASLLAQVLGTGATAAVQAGLNTTAQHTQTHKRRRAAKSKLDVDVDEVPSDVQAVSSSHARKRKPNTILVPGGNQNPFLDSNAPLLSET